MIDFDGKPIFNSYYERIMSDMCFVRSQHMQIVRLCKKFTLSERRSNIYFKNVKRVIDPEYYIEVSKLYTHWKNNIKPSEVKFFKDYGKNII